VRRGADSPPEECAVCGAEIPRTARACPECGADERTGWREQSIYDGLDLPDDEAASAAPRSGRAGPAWYWLAAAILLLLILGFSTLGLR